MELHCVQGKKQGTGRDTEIDVMKNNSNQQAKDGRQNKDKKKRKTQGKYQRKNESKKEKKRKVSGKESKDGEIFRKK